MLKDKPLGYWQKKRSRAVKEYCASIKSKSINLKCVDSLKLQIRLLGEIIDELKDVKDD